MLLTETINFERLAGQVSADLRTALQMLESKFCYMRWDGLVSLLELVNLALKDTHKIGAFLGNLMAKNKMQQRIFGLIIDGSSTGQITPVTTKETAIALEILFLAQKVYTVNPHSKGFAVLVRLVVETALPQVQAPALRLLLVLVQQSKFCMKSFRKSGGIEALAKWLKEQRGAAKAINTKPTLEVLEAASRLIACVSEDEGGKKRLEGLLGAKDLADLLG